MLDSKEVENWLNGVGPLPKYEFDPNDPGLETRGINNKDNTKGDVIMASPKSKIKKIHILTKEQMEGISAYDVDDHYYMCLRSCQSAPRENWDMFPLRQEPVNVLQNVVKVMDEHQEYLFLYIEFED